MNLFEARITDGGATVAGHHLAVGRTVLDAATRAGDTDVTLGIRPEDLTPADGGLPVRVITVEDLGTDAYVYGRLDSSTDRGVDISFRSTAGTHRPATRWSRWPRNQGGCTRSRPAPAFGSEAGFTLTVTLCVNAWNAVNPRPHPQKEHPCPENPGAGPSQSPSASLALTACGRDADAPAADSANDVSVLSDGPATGDITVWAMGTEAEQLPALADAFEAANPDASVTITAIPWDDAPTKISTAIASGQTPDATLLNPQPWPRSPPVVDSPRCPTA